jgi:hypothetical protein
MNCVYCSRACDLLLFCLLNARLAGTQLVNLVLVALLSDTFAASCCNPGCRGRVV